MTTRSKFTILEWDMLEFIGSTSKDNTIDQYRVAFENALKFFNIKE